jgi:hypothetical protein
MTSNMTAKLTAAAVAAVAALAMLVPAAQADTPRPGYERFAGCPSKAENPEVVFCSHAKIKSGHFQMGNKDVPIENPMTLTWGTDFEQQKYLVNSKGGLSKVKQKVPGGIIGLTGLTWLAEFFGSEALTLYAETELAGTPNLGDPTAPKLPIKVHLVHPVLGSKCYVGSNTSPINLNLTTGTTSPPPPNEPITGKEPEFTLDEAQFLFTFNNISYVDNSFAAPGANGCTLTLFGFIPISINGLVNTQSGLPSPAGTNETIQNQDLELTVVNVVYP